METYTFRDRYCLLGGIVQVYSDVVLDDATIGIAQFTKDASIVLMPFTNLPDVRVKIRVNRIFLLLVFVTPGCFPM